MKYWYFVINVTSTQLNISTISFWYFIPNCTIWVLSFIVIFCAPYVSEEIGPAPVGYKEISCILKKIEKQRERKRAILWPLCMHCKEEFANFESTVPIRCDWKQSSADFQICFFFFFLKKSTLNYQWNKKIYSTQI